MLLLPFQGSHLHPQLQHADSTWFMVPYELETDGSLCLKHVHFTTATAAATATAAVALSTSDQHKQQQQQQQPQQQQQQQQHKQQGSS
jgi:hypothetical protein